MLTGNKGEWSELYTFFKILTDGKLFAADSDLKKIAEKYFIVLKVIRDEPKIGKKIYDISKTRNNIEIYDEKNKRLGIVKKTFVKKRVKKIFEEMKNSSSRTFQISLAEETMKPLRCSRIKAGNNKKEDLILMVHDSISPTTPRLGFSIKSMLGSPSTLLNASGTTNFVYKISNGNVNKNKINTIKGASKVRDRILKIEKGSKHIEFYKTDQMGFQKNMKMIDTSFPEMMAEIIKAFYQGNGRTVSELVEYLNKKMILKEKFDLSKNDFSYKIKQFLCAVALGMTPKGKWDGLTKAKGGYIIVKENGELVCYHLYNRDEFQNYLFNNTKLETASTGRHRFGFVYEKDGDQFIKLNLQVRFLK
ncbi:HpaII family restriction endonuclease [Patescibacteria group bacterium]|nr:HpaII family restriction endonuclease [Patescibacteria group bacterium]MCG2702327.1 HpaII family restriction endonuclease [Candidatus Parcubacteria bacterium]MBU4264983.1 HpaII family restriction endonuclease [Patescibacteria group bacterium]MBU4389820.1 HpaII family restriction endonuclease [Patescibacteria group bacterium]MBU4430997.1 HpaII family restriction endonuclease [Patescibacteria group bacterium]